MQERRTSLAFGSSGAGYSNGDEDGDAGAPLAAEARDPDEGVLAGARLESRCGHIGLGRFMMISYEASPPDPEVALRAKTISHPSRPLSASVSFSTKSLGEMIVYSHDREAVNLNAIKNSSTTQRATSTATLLAPR